MFKVKHLCDRVRQYVERTAADTFAFEPVVFDKTEDRRLVGDRVIDEVVLRPPRYHEQRQAWTVTAAALCMWVDAGIKT